MKKLLLSRAPRRNLNEYLVHGLCCLLFFVTESLKKKTCTFICKTYSYPITRLDSPLGLQEVEATRISRQSAHEGGKVVNPTHLPSLPPPPLPGDNLVTHFC